MSKSELVPGNNTTVVICARDAGSTIARAVFSARRQGPGPIIVVDDGSTDDTAKNAIEAGRGAVKIVRPRDRAGLGNARQAGIESVETEFAVWLDADDELKAGRVAAMERELEDGVDIVFDEAELIDSVSKKRIRILEMPAFMLKENAMARTFERNYLPGPAWPGVRTELAKKIGYDVALPTGEDLDFNLRAFRSGARFKMTTHVGYRQIAYPESLSRNLSLQRGAVKSVLEKHRYEDVEKLLSRCELGGRTAFWALCSMAIFREDYTAANRYLGKAFPPGSDSHEILERDGPLPVEEGWKRAFFAGTLELLQKRENALRWLQEAEEIRPTPEGANNLGVAYFGSGHRKKAREQFDLALSRMEGYRDAFLNAQTYRPPLQVTTHPIRRHSSRSEYPLF